MLSFNCHPGLKVFKKSCFVLPKKKREHFCSGIGIMGAQLDGIKICQDIFYRVYQELRINLGKVAGLLLFLTLFVTFFGVA